MCAFPDAPTQRGARHIHELIRASAEGFGAYILFVIQMPTALYLHPNDKTDPAFSSALRSAAESGVEILAVSCHVTPDTMVISDPVEVRL